MSSVDLREGKNSTGASAATWNGAFLRADGKRCSHGGVSVCVGVGVLVLGSFLGKWSWLFTSPPGE